MLAGQNLRAARERLGLRMRDVETASERISHKYANDEYLIPISRLSDFETKDVIPSIYRIYSLAVIYRCGFSELLAWYGIDLHATVEDLTVSAPPKSHSSHVISTSSLVQMPVRLDPSFDPRKTLNFGRMVEQWGMVPMAYLQQFSKVGFTYGYIGSGGFTMHPSLPAGWFIQVE